jgi:hypothetical protein
MDIVVLILFVLVLVGIVVAGLMTIGVALSPDPPPLIPDW